MAGVFVVGSINQDFVLRVERRPEPGETVTDAELSLHGRQLEAHVSGASIVR